MRLRWAAFLAEQLQRLPKKGDRIIYKELTFKIKKAGHKRVRQVLVSKKRDSEVGQSADNNE